MASKLGDMLVKAQLITDSQLEEALKAVPLGLQHLGVSVVRRRESSLQRGVDMEA